MTPGLCACYKCVVSGRWWNLTVVDIVRDRPLVRACGSVSSFHELFATRESDTHTGTTTRTELGDTLVALYFGAVTCDVCQVFANELCSAQRLLASAGRRLEIVYVNADRDADEMFHFMKSRPQWHALRFDDPAVGELRSFLSVRDVPALVIIDNVGLVSRSGRRDLRTLGALAAWHKWTNAKLASSMYARLPTASTGQHVSMITVSANETTP